MAIREVGGGGQLVNYKDRQAGDLLAAGVWIGSRTGKFSDIYEIYNEETNETYLCPASGSLKYKFREFVSLGDYVEIEYAGLETMAEGPFRGKGVHSFKVLTDDDYEPTTAIGRKARAIGGQPIPEQVEAPAPAPQRRPAASQPAARPSQPPPPSRRNATPPPQHPPAVDVDSWDPDDVSDDGDFL